VLGSKANTRVRPWKSIRHLAIRLYSSSHSRSIFQGFFPSLFNVLFRASFNSDVHNLAHSKQSVGFNDIGPRITGIIRAIVWKIDLSRREKLRERTESQANDDGAPQPLEAERGVEPEEVIVLVEMGFCENVVIEARRAVDGDVRQALETLLR
jgi:hypothetical protein